MDGEDAGQTVGEGEAAEEAGIPQLTDEATGELENNEVMDAALSTLL